MMDGDEEKTQRSGKWEKVSSVIGKPSAVGTRAAKGLNPSRG
jgi:hypothetical protein